jgi:lipopolysaccharide export system permease protein
VILLNRYLLAQFATNFLTVSTAFVAIYLLVDFFEKIDKFTSHGGTMALALQFFFLNIPFILDQLGPVLILLAGVITLGILHHNNELRALKAGGIPLKTIVRPLIAGAVIITIVFLLMAQFLLPKTISTTNRIWYEQLQGKVPLGTYRSGRYYYKGEEGFYSFQWPDTTKLSFKSFSYSRWNENYNLKLLLNASQADWHDGAWVFHQGQTQELQEDGTFLYTTFAEKKAFLPESPEQFFVPEYRSAELSLTGLFREAGKKQTEDERTVSWAQFYSRISYIFLGIPLVLLGLPVLILTYVRWGRDLAIAIPASCLLAFVAWGLWGALQSFAKAGYIAPPLAASVIHFIFAGIGLLLLRQQDK